MHNTDYAIVGHSLAGVSAALTLAEAGGRVVLFDFHRDTDALADLPRVQSNPLAPSMSGAEFEQKLRALLERAEVHVDTTCLIESICSDGGATIKFGDRSSRSFKGVIFAPNGTEPGLDIEGTTALHGFGISYSAATDAPFYAGRRVAVWGDVPRVIEHAWTAAQHAAEVLVLAKGRITDVDVDLLTDLRSSPAVKFEEQARLASVQTGSDGVLNAIDVAAAEGRRIDVAGLFVAQNLVAITDVVNQKSATGKVAFAGLASGVSYWKHADLVADGARAARALLTS